MESKTFLAIFSIIIFFLFTSPIATMKPTRSYKPCKSMAFFFHDIIYNGENIANATAAIVGAPAWANVTWWGGLYRFGDVVVFNDLMTVENSLQSPTVGRAQGIYIYDSKDTYVAWLAFTFVFNSTEHVGTISFVGADPMMNKTRTMPVIGGIGDFFMHRGIATFTTDAVEGEVYFRLKVGIHMYECWS